MRTKVEFIESYIKPDGSADYIWHDNHGELIRCKDCRKNPKIAWFECPMAGKSLVFDEGYCHLGERREDVEVD